MGVFPGTNVFGNQVQLGNRDVQDIASGVFDFDIVFDDPLKLQLVDAVKNADTVGHMNDVIPRA